MRVTRLEVFGFKSFMERLVLPLEGGITGVVGPNGCGKSNVVDAIRWVLGETRARNLRGEVLEDVIFNGTDKLKPLGLAEVTITLRASGENFFSDLQAAHNLEVELAEILEATETELARVTHDSEPQITDDLGEPEKFEKDENGRPVLKVISGNFGNAPEAEAQVAEEIVETVSQKKTSLTNGSMPTLGTRFAWLKNVSEVQVTRRLYRSGESEFFINRTACRLKDLKELFRATGIGARAHSIVAQGEVARVISAKPEERRLILEEAAGVLGFRDKIGAATRRLEETNLNIARIDDILREVSRQVAILKRQANRAQNRQELKSQIASLEKSLARDKALELLVSSQRLEGEMEHASQAEANAEAALQRLQAEEHGLRNELMSFDIQGDSIRLRVDSIREEITQRARKQSDKRSRLSELQALALSSTAQLDKLKTQEETLKVRKSEIEQNIAGLEEKDQKTSELLAALGAKANSELQAQHDQVEVLNQELISKQQEIRTVREALIASRSTLEIIQAEIQEASSIEELKNRASDFDGNILAQGLKIPERYVRACQAVLAERASFLVVADPLGLAKNLLDCGAEIPVVGFLRSGDAPEILRKSQVPFPALLELIEVEAQYRASSQRLLSNVFVAEDLKSAISFLETAPAEVLQINFSIVTLAGEVLSPNSFYNLKPEVGVLQLISKAQHLRETVAQAESNLELLTAAQVKLEAELLSQKSKLQSLENEERERQSRAAELSAELGALRGELSAEKRSSAQLVADLQALSRQQAELSSKIEELKNEKQEVHREIDATLPDDDSELNSEVERLNTEYQEIDSKRKKSRENLAATASTLDQARKNLDASRAQVSELALCVQKVSLEHSALKDRLTSDYGEEFCNQVLDLNGDQSRLSEQELLESREEVQRLKARMLREGDVDPTSIQRYEEENTRLEDLTRQREDLSQAALTLRRTIERLSETSKERFLMVFEAVSQNFSKLVPRLFGGGKGSIELTDLTKPLECGVEILIRPPGKKLKNIDLLSGGEKALTATALVFAMFMERPSPLCVLDEVDAPLDEANLMRFLSLIREMSSKTQFLIITHNKQSMVLADNLVGVTMQEPGASKVIQVSLNEAIAQVA